MLKSLGIMLSAALVAFAVAMWAHSALADEVEAGPKWKIVVVLDGPPGRQEFVYGDSSLKRPHWFGSQGECDDARKGKDENFAKVMAQVKAKILALTKAGHMPPMKISTECRPDNSV